MFCFHNSHHSRPWSLGSWKWRGIHPGLCQWLLGLGHFCPQHASPWFLTNWVRPKLDAMELYFAVKRSHLPWMGWKGLYHLHTPGLWSSSCPLVCQTGHSQCHTSAGQLEHWGVWPLPCSLVSLLFWLQTRWSFLLQIWHSWWYLCAVLLGSRWCNGGHWYSARLSITCFDQLNQKPLWDPGRQWRDADLFWILWTSQWGVGEWRYGQWSVSWVWNLLAVDATYGQCTVEQYMCESFTYHR